jgi:hypothetical protein
LIFPYRIDEDGQRIEMSFLIKKNNFDVGAQYSCIGIKTIKDNFGMIIDEIITKKIEQAPKNARFNVAQKWSKDRFDNFVYSMRKILSGIGSDADFEKLEELF